MNDELFNRNGSVEGERLRLVPLNIQQLKLSLEDYVKLQKSLDLKVGYNVLDGEMQYAMKIRLKKVLEDPENWLWLTNWAIVLKEQKEIVGFIMLKGYPNKLGEVIMGYGINEGHRKNGYATEAVKAMKRWIFKDPKTLCIVADTEKDNILSHKVLINAGAVKYEENNEIVWWKIDRNLNK